MAVTMAETFQLFTSLRYDPALLKLHESELKHAGWNRENASALYMLDYHRDRMLRAATHWGWDAAVRVLSGEAGLTTLSELVLGSLGGREGLSSRVRVTITKDGELAAHVSEAPRTGIANLFPDRLPVSGRTETSDVLPLKEPAYEVVLDEQKTRRSEYTHFKTTRRVMYDQARQRAKISLPDPKEVLIVNAEDDTVMEGSITTPYFWRDNRWVTPPVSSQFSREDGSGGNDGTTRRWALQRYVGDSTPRQTGAFVHM